MIVMVNNDTGIVTRRYYSAATFDSVYPYSGESKIEIEYLDVEKQYKYNFDTATFEEFTIKEK